MITEDYVSFNTAKLLKEKGFDEPCQFFYFSISKYKQEGVFIGNFHARKNNEINEASCSAPTLQMATKWLRENFNMNPVPYATSNGWYFEVFDLTKRDITGCAPLYQVGIPPKEKMFETYEEACEAAIRYTLENLI
jgi:hypothetical protein